MKEWNERNSQKNNYMIYLPHHSTKGNYGFAFEILFWATLFLGG
jgi:hypothetical protein